MTVKLKPPVCQQLKKAYNLICYMLSNSNHNKSPLQQNHTNIKKGLTLYHAAYKADKTYRLLKDRQLDGTFGMVQVSKPALDAYQSLYKIVCAVWDEGKIGLESQGVCGKLSNSTEGFLANAFTLFSVVAKNPGLAERLKEYGYTREKLGNEKAKIIKMEKFFRSQEADKKSLKCASCARQKALKDLDSWMSGLNRGQKAV